jgi:threonine dehydrogenase-like Zn-dependent dehydrogenase
MTYDASGTMRAVAVTAPGEVKIVYDVPKPVPGDHDAVIRVRSCGFCNGTDFQIINGATAEEEGLVEYPVILGHEGAGEVIAIGNKVRNIRIGDRYFSPYLDKNVGGGYSSAYGSMCDYSLVLDVEAAIEDGVPGIPPVIKDKCFRLPKDFDFIDGGMMISLLECHSAVRNFGISKGMDVLVYGAGPMGLALMSFMRLAGVASITLIDGVDERLRKAEQVARVDRAIDFSKTDPEKELNGRLFDAAVDVVGSTQIILGASKKLKPCGKVCVMGVLKHADSTINLRRIQNSVSVQMLTFPLGRRQSLQPVLNLISEGKLNPKDYYSHVLPMTEINECMEMIKNKTALKVILGLDD